MPIVIKRNKHNTRLHLRRLLRAGRYHDPHQQGHHFVTVIINIPRALLRDPRRTGHVGLVLWSSHHGQCHYRSHGILMDGSIEREGVNPHGRGARTRRSRSLDLWYFTMPVEYDSFRAMEAKVQEIRSPNHHTGYSEFVGSRYGLHWYNCVTFVDAVLANGGLSGTLTRFSSWSTPWAYSCFFQNWDSAVMHNHTNL